MTTEHKNDKQLAIGQDGSDVNSSTNLAQLRKTGQRTKAERRPITLYLRPTDPTERQIIEAYNGHSHGQDFLRDLIRTGFISNQKTGETKLGEGAR